VPAPPPETRAGRTTPTRGGATLAVVLVLLLGVGMVTVLAQRSLLIETRSAAQQTRATRALHAADAGRDWALVMLDHRRAVDAACVDSSPGGGSLPGRFRERYLPSAADASGSLSPRSLARPGCVRHPSSGWLCRCPDSGDADLAAALGSDVQEDAPAFLIQFERGPRAGSLLLRIDGCSSPAAGCGGSSEADASARVEQLLHPLGHSLRPPAAALVSSGEVMLGPGSTLINTDAASGALTLQARGNATLDAAAQLVSAPGRLPQSSTVLQDSRVPADAERGLPLAFGLSLQRLRQMPAWQRIDCSGGCTGSEVQAALDQGQRALWLEGPLLLGTDAQWGSAEQPLLLVVRGEVRVSAALRAWGLLWADSLDWSPAGATPARWIGGVVSFGSSRLNGPVQLQRDETVLQLSRSLAASLLPVPGSWRDFDRP
jgi:hypothetical protein